MSDFLTQIKRLDTHKPDQERKKLNPRRQRRAEARQQGKSTKKVG